MKINEIREHLLALFREAMTRVFDNTLIRDKGNITDFDFIEVMEKVIYISGEKM